MKWFNNLMTMFKETSFSLFSDGKVSLKRVLAFLFALAILWMVTQVVLKVIPHDNQNIFEHCFDGLLMTIAALLGAATWKDAYSAKQKKTDTPEQ